ncbi:Tn3 family transposase, partial [Acidiphilium multivorum]|uniref:Tn3 family transposase n=1 Tax=Acidiphilium multivorum TaxID=62140 RepID=UPI001B8B7E0A
RNWLRAAAAPLPAVVAASLQQWLRFHSPRRGGKLLSPDLLAHVSPLGWEHINLTGEYRWPKP